MNHDEKNPNPDMQSWIEPELEARVVAWVLGEASPFEVAELERLLREKPELAIFKRRIEAVHGLVGEAARPDREPLKLSAERRAKLLRTIGAAETVGETAAPMVLPLPATRRQRRRVLPWIWGAAACLAVGGLVATSMQKTYQRKSPQVVAFAQAQGRDEQDMSQVKGENLAGRSRDAAEKGPVILPFELPTDVRTAQLRTKVEEAEAEIRQAKVAPRAAASKQMLGGRLEKNGESFGGRGGTRGNPTAPMPVADSAKTVAFTGSDASAVALGSAMAGRVASAASAPASSPPPVEFQFRGAPVSPPAETRSFGFNAGPEGTGQIRGLASADLSLSEPSVSLVSTPAGGALTTSPFTVSTDRDVGYYATNTVAGTRLNSSISDLASSVTVQTKEQLANVAQVGPADAFLDAKKRAESTANELKPDNPAPRPTEPATKVEETTMAKEPVSTFSLHVSDVSFRLAQAALARGEVPEPVRIRPEEFYNAFDYGDPAPTLAEKVGARIEQSAHPVLQQRNLLRVAFKVPAAGRAASQPLRLTVLLDTSGSMEREDRVATVRRALAELVALLKPEDRVTLIGFARQPRLLAEAVRGNQAGMLVSMVARTPSEGGTNLEEALKLAGELARRHQLPGAQNRIVLLTDGAANLGNANPAQLATAVETLRQQGIAFDACGVGLNGLDDGILERLTRSGDGRYYVLDSPDAADTGFARQLAGAFRPAAENVKVQVRFNPARVGRYRLIGFDQHRLAEQDFRNDAVDAAELAAEEAAVALYEVEVLPQGSGEVGELFVRFRDPASGMMVERSWTIAHDPQARAFDRATPSLQLAGVSALLAEKLRQSPVASQFKLGDLVRPMNALRGAYSYEPRVQELATMFEQARSLGRD